MDDLMDLWCRGAAVQCMHSQVVIDGFFVGYQGNLDAPLDCNNFVIIPWRTRYTADSGDNTAVDSLVCPLIEYHDRRLGKPEKHLVIFMDLGTSTPFGDDGSLQRLTFGPTIRDTDWQGYVPRGQQEPSRFCLNIRGHGIKT